jgi:hypothetical protein
LQAELAAAETPLAGEICAEAAAVAEVGIYQTPHLFKLAKRTPLLLVLVELAIQTPATTVQTRQFQQLLQLRAVAVEAAMLIQA